MIHTHPRWAYGVPAYGDYQAADKYDVYGIHEGGVWAIFKWVDEFTILSGRNPTKPRSSGSGC